MTSRERVELALRHEEPDRVPLDIGGTGCSTLTVEAHERLRLHLGIPRPTRVLSEYWRMAWVDEEIMQRLGADLRLVALRPPKHWSPPACAPGTYVDEWGIGWRKVEHVYGYYWDMVSPPLANATIEDLASYPWPDPLDEGRFEGLAEQVRRLYHDTPFALVGDPGFKQFFERAMWLRGGAQWLMDLALNPEFVQALLDKLMELNLAATGRMLEIAGPYLSVVRTADDLAAQDAPLLSPATYRRLIKPYHEHYFHFIKQHTPAKVFLHCCGNLVPLLDDLLDAGMDIWRTVQLRGIPMRDELKARYGKNLTFWGGIDVQQVLPKATPEQVCEEVRARMRQFGPGGGYVVAATHNIQADVPPENILAMADAVREWGKYPLRA